MMNIDFENNTLTLSNTLNKDVDGLYDEITTIHKLTYASLEVINISNQHQLVKAVDKNAYITLYNMDGVAVCKVPTEAAFDYFEVLGSLYVKVITGEQQVIYDLHGNKLVSNSKCELKVQFSGCGAAVVALNKSNGNQEFMFTLD